MGSRRGTRLALAGVALVAALVAVGCGDNDDGPIPQTGVRQTTTTAPPTTTSSVPATTEVGASGGESGTGASTTTTAPSGG